MNRQIESIRPLQRQKLGEAFTEHDFRHEGYQLYEMPHSTHCSVHAAYHGCYWSMHNECVLQVHT